MTELPIIPGRGLVTKLSTQMRLDFLSSVDIKTNELTATQIDLQSFQNCIESYIGTVEIPLGIVGPLLYNGSKKEELVYCAAGTLEGALVASMNRGCKAISNSSGFSASIAWQKMCRAPMFLFESENDAIVFKIFVEGIFKSIKKVAENYSNHARLEEIQVIQLNNVVHLKFVYTTGDASGQNMTTTCTWHAMIFIADKFKTETGIAPIDFVIEGNGSSDKKVSEYNITSGRGINVTAECTLPEKVIQEVLRTSSDKIVRCFKPSQELAARDGMVGYNINVANAIASIFIATGQDMASVHESGVGFLELTKTAEGLHLRLNLPNLVIGTVGGGTNLPKQSQALEIMKCRGNGKVERFAKLIAGFALGLEISTYSAIVSGEFAKAHEKLGRNKPIRWLLRSELTPDFIRTCLNGSFAEKKVKGILLKNDVLIDNGIITNVAARISKKLIGFIPIEISYEDKSGEQVSLNLLIKSKALDEEVIKGLHLIAASIDPHLSDLFKKSKQHLEFRNSHLKELELYSYLHEQGFKNMPYFYGMHKNPKREIYFFIQQYLDVNLLKIMNSGNQPEKWNQEDILRTIQVITHFHKTVDRSRLTCVQEFLPWNSTDLYKKLLSILIHERADPKHETQLVELSNQIDHFQNEAAAIQLPRTIIHNDFNPRNIAVEMNGEPVIYDWELAVIDFPHRDIVEFLSFAMAEDFEKEDMLFFLKYHFQLYPGDSWEEWMKAYRYSLKVFIATRVSFYEVSGILIKYEFSSRILSNAFRMLTFLKENE